MKSQYPSDLISCQNNEPADYLLTYTGIRQISKKRLKVMKASYKRMLRKKVDPSRSPLGKAEDDGLGSFFYNQTFRLDSDD